MMVWRTGRGRRAQRRMIRWTRYRDRCDRLVSQQPLTSTIQHPMKTTPGYFRAEGWNTGARSVLRNGC